MESKKLYLRGPLGETHSEIYERKTHNPLILLEPRPGIEPGITDYKSVVIPFNYRGRVKCSAHLNSTKMKLSESNPDGTHLFRYCFIFELSLFPQLNSNHGEVNPMRATPCRTRSSTKIVVVFSEGRI